MAASHAAHWRPPARPFPKRPLPIENESNLELADKFGERLIAQRFLKSAHQAYTKVAYAFCHFLAKKLVSSGTHMEVRYSPIARMRRGLAVDGFNRHFYAV